jgi:cardiolipin synthase
VPAASTATWRDTHLQLQGPVVAELQKLFIANWLQQTGKLPLPRNYFPPPQIMGRLVVRAIGSAPAEDDGSPIYTTLLSAIASAETTVYITNAYFAPDPQLLAALKEAAARGVDVQLILPGQTDSWLLFHAGRDTYDDLLQSGVKIHERRGAVLHSKTALIDGVWSTVGSTNLDWRSFLHNQEVNAVVLGTEFGDQMQRMFNTDRAASDPVLLPTWRDRSVMSRVQEWFARLWAYWL